MQVSLLLLLRLQLPVKLASLRLILLLQARRHQRLLLLLLLLRFVLQVQLLKLCHSCQVPPHLPCAEVRHTQPCIICCPFSQTVPTQLHEPATTNSPKASIRSSSRSSRHGSSFLHELLIILLLQD
jgi:hypothetical protein